MNFEETLNVVKQLKFQDYHFVISTKGDALYLQGRYTAPDIVTKQPELQHTRKWLLSEHMTKSEIVQTAFKLCLTSMEHRTREEFTYKGKRIFGPHFDVDALVEICIDQRFDCRPEPT